MKNSLLVLSLVFAFGCQTVKENKEAVALNKRASCVPVTSDKAWYKSNSIAPLFENLGDLHFPVSTDNELAQKYFDQGLVLAYGFNHAEAARSFYYASKLDPECAMAYWGYAYVLGPNYNAGMESDNYERAYVAIQTAIDLAKDRATEKERSLIMALSKRYVKEPVADRYALDEAYAAEMMILHQEFPDDADIGALTAEAMMNLHPWDLYDAAGNLKEWTPPILNTLEGILEKHPEHSGANHFYIHAIESSQTPEKGLISAKRFDDGLVPNAGHLVHMPSHIYIRTGDYHKGSLANIQAIVVDSTYVSACNAQGAYPLAYFPHNQHFLAATATLEGNSHWALQAADAVAANANLQLMKEPGWGTIQHYYTIPFYVYVKFGKWDEILRMENAASGLDYPTAMLHYARGMAFAAQGHIEKAKAELSSLAALAANETLKEVTIWDINSVYELVQIAEKVLRAEILAEGQNYDQSITMLKEAIAIEDKLNYNEPPDWFFSVRHSLGAHQLAAGKAREAVQTYLADLERLPRNGWALHGLVQAYTKLNEVAKAQELAKQWKTAWAHADVELQGSVVE
ncbi:MAG: tetratricopeptide repeat protein [Bacteroidia bacterium]